MQPFNCTYSPNFPALLHELGCSLALSTYQAGKVIVLSEQGGGLVQLPRTFDKPMGLALDGDRMAVATRESTVVLMNAPGLAPAYPGSEGKYDAVYAPRAVYFSGEIDAHDMAWQGDRLLAVNTRFSCLCHLDHQHSFTPIWKPPFVTDLVDDDRCHLNGMAMVGGKPRYVTALGRTNTPRGWRETKLTGGILIDVASGEVVLHGLAMPHSPRVYDGEIFVLLSATGELAAVDAERGTWGVITRLPGFARGLDRLGEFLFIGTSKLRPGRSLGDLPLAQQELSAGVVAFHLPSGRIAGQVTYLSDCEEIYDVKVLPGKRRPGLLGLHDPLYRHTLTTPQYHFWGNPTDPDARTPLVPSS